MFQRTFPYFVPLKRIIPAVHLAVFRATNGRLSSTLAGQNMLLLTTRGRRSGKPRTVPLLYVEDIVPAEGPGATGTSHLTPGTSRYVVIGSNWAGPRHPLWVGNLLARPEARVQVRSKRRRVTASIASGTERQRLWALVTQQYSEYNEYARRIGNAREIPLVVLTPRTSA